MPEVIDNIAKDGAWTSFWDIQLAARCWRVVLTVVTPSACHNFQPLEEPLDHLWLLHHFIGPENSPVTTPCHFSPLKPLEHCTPGYPSPVPPTVAASPPHIPHLWHRIRDTSPSLLAVSTVLEHDYTLRSILSTFISLQPLVALEFSRFAADPLLLFHLSNSRHQLTPSMGFWLLLSIALRRDFYAEQLNFQWSTDSLLQAGGPGWLSGCTLLSHKVQSAGSNSQKVNGLFHLGLPTSRKFGLWQLRRSEKTEAVKLSSRLYSCRWGACSPPV